MSKRSGRFKKKILQADLTNQNSRLMLSNATANGVLSAVVKKCGENNKVRNVWTVEKDPLVYIPVFNELNTGEAFF